MFEPLQKYFHRVAKEYGVSRELNAALILFYTRNVIADLFKKMHDVGEYVDPSIYSRGTIIIKVKSSAWANEITMRKEKIIEEVNKKIGKPLIKKITTKQV